MVMKFMVFGVSPPTVINALVGEGVCRFNSCDDRKNVEVVLHGEKKVPADNLKNTDGMRVRIPSTLT